MTTDADAEATSPDAEPAEPPASEPTSLARRPTTALAVREPACVLHTFDIASRTCLVCGLRIYVEVLIT